MTLNAGQKLGPYEIVGPLGAGGMGEVYRATDTRLERQVAIKVLPAALTGSEQFRARFEREAKTISKLNHPNICTLHDIGSDDGTEFLVMEYLEGQSLAERLEQGPVPLDEAIRYAIQIANALDRAHRQGVVHRDLKPGNVMITPSGAKLLDFGLAKMAREAAEPVEGLTNLQTEQKDLTEEGTILGTVQYMAPEQLEGTEADARTDIFAFGMLLFEMITGRKVFQGKSRMSLMAAIMEHEPPSINSLQPLSPPVLDRLIRTCLEKNPDDRWQTAHDLELQLRWIEEGGSEVGLPAPVAARRKDRERVSWAIALVGVVAAIGFALLWIQGKPEPEALERFTILPPTGGSFDISDGLAVSPDGSRVAFVAEDDNGSSRIYVRGEGEIEPRPLTGTEGGWMPFWSPDGDKIGFVVGGKLKRIAASGGPPQTICEVTGFRGGVWTPDGRIIFSAGDMGGDGVLHIVPAGGGTSTPLTTLDEERGEQSHRWPSMLPGGTHALFVAQTGEGNVEDDASTIEVVNLETGERTRVVGANSSVQYVPTGHILFWREGSVLAQPFDPETLELTGDPVPLVDGVGYSGLEFASFSASNEGTIVYQTGNVQASQLTWFDREGSVVDTVGEESSRLLTPKLSWDGRKLAFTRDEDIWVVDLERRTSTRLTFDDAEDWSPVWSPDDAWIAFGSDRSPHGIYRKRSSGIGEVETVVTADSGRRVSPVDWSADGKYISINMTRPETAWDAARIATTDGEVEVLVATPFVDADPMFSPDGNWIAVMSNESGRPEIYVYQLGDTGGRWQLSTNGGAYPIWSRDGRTVYYLEQGTRLMAVEVGIDETFRAGTPEELMTVSRRPGFAYPYDVTDDESRFIWNVQAGGAADAPPLTIVRNWPHLLGATR